MQKQHTVLCIQDLSCVGRCSLAVVLPALAAMGVQPCALPTALLSAHTGFTGGSFLDLTDEMTRITEHWEQIGLRFDGIYSGFLGSAAQIDVVERVIRRFRGSSMVIVDPVLGDHGKAYRTCTPELCRGMRQLAEQADGINWELEEIRKTLPELKPYIDLTPVQNTLVEIQKSLTEMNRLLERVGNLSEKYSSKWIDWLPDFSLLVTLKWIALVLILGTAALVGWYGAAAIRSLFL